MAKFICELEGVRGRVLKIYANKLVIVTKKTLGSFITGNITDGEKTVFLCDIVGIQYKKSGLLIGYLQFETSSLQMNNKNDNFFSENTFTFEINKNGVTNELIEAIYSFILNRIEEIKYNTIIIDQLPNFERMKSTYKTGEKNTESQTDSTDIDYQCPQCNTLIKFGVEACPKCNQIFIWNTDTSNSNNTTTASSNIITDTTISNNTSEEHKCPNCKEMLPPEISICPICGKSLSQ